MIETIIKWLGGDVESIGAIGSFATAIITLAYTFATFFIFQRMREANRMNQEQEHERRRAHVFFDFVHDRWLIYAEVRNDGSTAARNIELDIPKKIADIATQGKIPFSLSLPISYLSPGKSIRTLVSTGPDLFARLENPDLTVSITYEDVLSNKHKEEIKIDLTYMKYLVEQTKPEVAEGVEKIAKTFDKLEKSTANTSKNIKKIVETPPPLRTGISKYRYSQKALAVAREFVRKSKYGMKLEPQLRVEELVNEETKLTLDDALEAINELEEGGFVTCEISSASDDPSQLVIVEDSLFVEFDRFWRDWDTEEDARRIATDMVSDESFPSGLRNALNMDRLEQMKQIASRYNWKPRRLNPALCWLEKRKLVTLHRALGTRGYVCFAIDGNFPALRRFVKMHRDEQTTDS